MPGTTPVYGFPYPEPTDLVADYPALGQNLAEDIEAVLPTIAGLMPATPTSIANSGGSASLTGNTVTFTGVSNVSLNGCFTGDYDNYRIIIDTSSGTTLRWRSGTTDNSSAIYYGQSTEASGTGVSAARASAQTSHNIGLNLITLDVLKPFAAVQTRANAHIGPGTTSIQIALVSFYHDTATSYSGFTLLGTSISGTVSVYGYKK